MRPREALILQDETHLGVGETGLLLDRLIHHLHDPVVGVRREPITLLGIEAMERIHEPFDAGRSRSSLKNRYPRLSTRARTRPNVARSNVDSAS